MSGSLTGAGAEGGVAASVMSNLDRKITDDFSQYTVRKDLVSEVKGNALVPHMYLGISAEQIRDHHRPGERASMPARQRVRDILADNTFIG